MNVRRVTPAHLVHSGGGVMYRECLVRGKRGSRPFVNQEVWRCHHAAQTLPGAPLTWLATGGGSQRLTLVFSAGSDTLPWEKCVLYHKTLVHYWRNTCSSVFCVQP